jgi:lipopolysaccharide export system protein LptC
LTSVSSSSADRRSAFQAQSGRDSGGVYRRALRHSRHVRLLRIGVIVMIGMVLAGTMLENYLPSVGGFRLPAEISGLVINGTKITMQQPRMTGYTSDNRAYEFRANAAAQDISKPDLVQLERIRAQMAMADKSTVHLWADTGLYDTKADTLTLNDHIRLVSTTGYEARLRQAVVDMRQGNVVSDTPIWVKLLDGDLNAKHLEIVDKGDVVRFTNVTMILQSNGKSTKTAAQ